MSDNLERRGPEDQNRINLKESWEVKYWTNALGVSKEELERAVKAVGNSAAAVRKHLGKS